MHYEFVLFGATLLGVAVFHHFNLQIAVGGLVAIVLYKLLLVEGFSPIEHLQHEAPLLINLLGLLVGFEILADHFRVSKLATKIPALLPDDWRGGFVLLVLVFIFSTFLDNIAAAMIGAAIATTVFGGHLRVGYLAAIVAASNGGGAGSVIGDTTTTMMWIDGVAPQDVLHAFLPSIVALLVYGIPLSMAQQKEHPIQKDPTESTHIDYPSLVIVGLILIGAVIGNVKYDFPALGVWVAIVATMWWRRPNWKHVPKAARGSLFLLSLVLSASLMPVSALPNASPFVAYVLGYVSAVFDNIPLTKLALDQGGYDWGWLAFTVGFGGSMMWFGSSAGVAVSNDHPRLKNTLTFLRESWIIILAFSIAFATLLILGWNPHIPQR